MRKLLLSAIIVSLLGGLFPLGVLAVEETTEETTEESTTVEESTVEENEESESAEGKEEDEEEEYQKDIDKRLEEYRNAAEQRKVKSLQRYAKLLIDKRLQSLEKVRSRVLGNERLTESEQAALLQALDATEAGLEDLRSFIDDEEELDELRSQVESVIYDYRVYAVLIPQTYGLAAADVLENAIDEKVSGAFDKLKDALEKLESEGIDVSDLQVLVDELEEYIESAEDNVQLATAELNKMEPAKDLTQAQTQLKNARGYLNSARDDLKSARDVMNKLVIEFRSLQGEVEES